MLRNSDLGLSKGCLRLALKCCSGLQLLYLFCNLIKTKLNKILAFLSSHSPFYFLNFCPQIHSQAMNLCILFLSSIKIGSRTVHILVRRTIYGSLHTTYDVDVSKRIISVVVTPQPFLQVTFEEIFGCSHTRHTLFDSPLYIFSALGVRTCIWVDKVQAVVNCEMTKALIFEAVISFPHVGRHACPQKNVGVYGMQKCIITLPEQRNSRSRSRCRRRPTVLQCGILQNLDQKANRPYWEKELNHLPFIHQGAKDMQCMFLCRMKHALTGD